ncbi:hypothetical protein [Lichenibacterium ramalinae]|nr:hypothetical protein [Lichenibacterium ramalinae]
MMGFTTRGTVRRMARVAIAGAAMMAAVQGASADDAGVHDFFSAIFGGGQTQAAPASESAAPAPGYDAPMRRASRPLTVRLHRPKPRIVYVDAPTKPAPVSIFEDRTLRRGDAVMTAKGVRIFAGSSSWPYSERDFVGLTDASQVSKDTSKVLAQLDKLPRG